MTELKPCPFCGGEGTYSADNRITDDAFFAYVECDTCHCTSAYADTAAQAINAWNNRQPTIDWQPIDELKKGFFDYALLYWQRKNIVCIGYLDDSNTIDIVCFDSDLPLSLTLDKSEFTRFSPLTPPEKG